MPRHQLRRRAERPGPDDRVVVGRVHVDGRRQVQVGPGVGEVAPDRGVHLGGQRRIVDHAQRRVPRIGAPGPMPQPGDIAALLVDRDQRVRPGRPQRRGQLGELGRRPDVRPEQGVPGQPVAEQVERPARRLFAGKRGEQGAEGETAQSVIDRHDVLPVTQLWLSGGANCHDRYESMTLGGVGGAADGYAAATTSEARKLIGNNPKY
jgi:hypothetical protein